ncbi:putative mediator complex protein [Diaporthe ampelina]|uniref:Mediator of RNA polymerase II transcription subunit 11 n=1 Tax=Diaporthe ampelina TaxID=1214573 RepID=A0A0G2FQM4_9PEZI|nr:putative mediator complex protein [Diaporthe ampelina]
MEQSNPPVDIHAPFTRAERMQQLADIDRDIASLLDLTGTAIQSLGKQSLPPAPATNSTGTAAPEQQQYPQPQPQPQPSAAEQTRQFEDAMNKFLSTLHSVDARLKRQILGLDEAGIISLPSNKDAAKDKPKDDDGPGAGAGPKPALEPDGVGMVGDLDVGWLNSRSNQVEREMEAELWTKARKHLEALSGVAGAGLDQGGDAHMMG